MRPIEELKDISKASKPNKMGSGSIKVMSNTKWTPITPSVTISGSKDTNSKSGNDHRNVKSNRKTKKRGSNNSNISEKVFNGESSAPYEIHTICNAKPKYFDTNAKANTYLSSGTTTDVNNKKIANGESSPNGKQLKNFQNKYSRTRYNNENHSSRYNKITHYDGYFSSSRPSKSEYISNSSHWLNNNTRPGYNQQVYLRPQQYYNNYNYQQQLQTPYYYSMEPIFKSIESIKNQIEFYFSEENLKTDDFLRSKFNKTNDGFVPMSLIGKFYRMVNLSLGGDPNLILASVKEVLHNKETNGLEIALGSIDGSQKKTVDEFDPLENYFIRRKNWSDYITENSFDDNDKTYKYKIEKFLEPGDLDDYHYISYPNFYSGHVDGKNNQTFDQGKMSREFQQNLQMDD